MKLLYACLFLISVTMSGLAQTVAAKVVRWDITDKKCDNWVDRDRVMRSYEDDKLLWMTSVLIEDKYISFWVGFSNKAKERLEIDPAAFSLTVKDQTYPAVDAATVAKKYRNRGRWAGAVAAGLAGMSSKQTTGTIRDSNGNTSTVSVTSPDYEAQRRARQGNASRNARNADAADTALDTALPRQTLFQDDHISGFVYFDKKKFGDQVLLKFTVNGVTYEVPILFEIEK